jgi:hypothetical protein
MTEYSKNPLLCWCWETVWGLALLALMAFWKFCVK